MTYDKIVSEILDSYLNYVSDKYFSVKDNQLKTGLNKYNEIVKDKDFLIINDFTAGRFTNILSSFLFVGVSNNNATQGYSIGDALAYNNNINLTVRVYKQIKQPNMFIAFNIIPLVLNKITREWLASIIENEGNFTITNINMSNAEPAFDYGSTNSIYDFSSIRGLIVELNINFQFFSNNEEV